MEFENHLKRELFFAPFIEKTLAYNAGFIQDSGIKLFSMQKASAKDDMEKGFDFVFTMGDITVPVRVRTPSCKFRDFTIRSKSRHGFKTEIDKLREGFGDVYFYGWTKWEQGQEVIIEWCLINLNRFRESGLANIEKPQTSNGDGTCFINYKLKELEENHCIIASYKPPAQNFQQLLPFHELL